MSRGSLITSERLRGPRAQAWLRTHALALATATLFGVMAWAHRWLHEDGLINLRVVENLLAGRGPVYNAGERVEAFTSPLQVAALTLGRIATFGLVSLADVTFLVGVSASVAGLWLAMRGATHLWGADEPGRLLLPVGALAFAAVPLTWDFATSGHEASVGYLWVGACTLAIARRCRELRVGLDVAVDRPRWALVAIGSGALVRPEYAIFTAAYLLWWFLAQADTPGSRLRAAAWALGPTVGYQVFRMGYFALLVPNTALAKLGGSPGPDDGWHYLASFAGPFWLWVPLVGMGTLAGLSLRGRSMREAGAVAALAGPPVVVVAYLVSIGGDYVNGRLLVVPLLALLAPVAVVDGRLLVGEGRRLRVGGTAAAAVVALWAVVSATALRPPYDITSSDFLDVRYDAREIAVRHWVGKPPTAIDDYAGSFLAGPYLTLAAQLPRTDGGLLVVDDPDLGRVLVLAADAGPVIASPTIGALGVVAGVDVRIIDRLALADPVASHLPATGVTPGHLRQLPLAWVYARAGVAVDAPSKAAMRAMTCGRLGRLMDDVTGPLTPSGFLGNVLHAVGNTALDVPSDPQEAVDAFC